jgi:hypothetical protein
MSDDPFTPEMMHDILCDVLKRGTKPAAVDHPVNTHMARAVNLLSHDMQNWLKPQKWHDELDRIEKVTKTIRALTKQLLQQRDYYTEVAASDPLYAIAAARPQLKARIEALDALLAAADATLRFGLPQTSDGLFFPGNPRERLKHIKHDLHSIFKSNIPDASSGDLNRFVERIIGTLTGYSMTPAAIKKEMERS